MRVFKDLITVFFPNLCPGCGEAMGYGDDFICIRCMSDLPFSELRKDNPLAIRMAGRLPISGAYTFLKFTKGGIIQNILHKIKYGNRPDLGIILGEQFGQRLVKASLISDTDIIIPVPLHKSKMKKRGYNQSEQFACGIAEKTGFEILKDGMLRRQKGKSQTTKSRFERLKSVSDSFIVRDPALIEGKTILLVDDVFTTGATLEACGIKLFEAGAEKLYLATIAEA